MTLDLKTNFPDLFLNLWYLDDGHLAGKKDDLINALDIIREKGVALGLHLNLSKCVVFGSTANEFPPEIKRAEEGLNVLGSPVGSVEFVRNRVNEIICEASGSLFKSRQLEDPQMELLLVRCCSGAPKIAFWNRTCNSAVITEQTKFFDDAIDLELQHILEH